MGGAGPLGSAPDCHNCKEHEDIVIRSKPNLGKGRVINKATGVLTILLFL